MATRKLLLNPAWRLTLLWVSLLLAVAPAGADVYKWTDANGRVHFGDRAPGTEPVAPIARAAARQTRGLELTVADDNGVLDDATHEQVETGVQRIYEVYTGLFHLQMRKPVRVDIRLFETREELADWVAEVDGGTRIPSGILGLYLPKQNLIGAWRHSDDPAQIVATLLHESSHVIVAQLAPATPAWLQEGLAQYFEGLDPDSDGYVIRPRADALAAIENWTKQKQLVTLQQYFALDEARWRHLAHVEHHPVPYAVAWSVCYFLMSKPVGRQIVNELLQDMEKTGKAPTANAIERRYPGGYALMEYEWFKWAQRPKPPQELRW